MQEEKIYLVGGAVRDSLLGLSVTERDWVVVGGCAQDLINKGFKQVGQTFPVFLHPETNEEYALARVERKDGFGHKGFELNFPASISIEEDLKRRDFTINAMAQDCHGNIIDPWGGQKDLQLKIIRHVSEAFSEDPLRVFRAARFNARFSNLGFSIAPETLKLMQKMLSENEIAYLSGERIWKETEYALRTRSPEVFFEILNKCNALKIVFPGIEKLCPAQVLYSLDTLKKSAQLSADSRVRFAAFIHQLTKKLEDSEGTINRIFSRLKLSNKYKSLVKKVHLLSSKYLELMELEGIHLALLLKELGASQKNNDISLVVLACEAIFHGDTIETEYMTKFEYLTEAETIFSKSTVTVPSRRKLTGENYGRAVFQAKVEQLDFWIKKIKENKT